MQVILLILPDFLLIALGWILLHKLGYEKRFFDGAEKLVYFVLFPALLFHSITSTPLDLGSTANLFTATMGVMFGGIALAWLGLGIMRTDPVPHASVAQCAFRFNTYLALSMAGNIGIAGAQTTMAVIVGFAVPISNIGAVHALATRHGGGAVKEIIKNPFIIATLAGLACNLLQVPIPHALDVTLSRLGACAIAIGLLCVGATISLRGGRKHMPIMSWMIFAKLVLLPIWGLAIGHLLNMPLLERQMILLFAALPTASSAHVLAARMGGNGQLVAVTMSIGTLVSALTLPVWLGYFF